MTDVKLTPAQRRAAEAVKAGRIRWTVMGLGFYSTRPSELRTHSMVLPDLVSKHLAARRVGSHQRWKGPVDLTDLGRAVIANG